MNIEEFKARVFQREGAKEEYDALEQEFALLKSTILARREAGLAEALQSEASPMPPFFLPGLPEDAIRACYAAAPGNEIVRGKLSSPESSAALAANAFGFFLQRAADLPVLPGVEASTWPTQSVTLEAELRFPWRGGRHPWLDILVRTADTIIGIESKRYEPFRAKPKPQFSTAYVRHDWGKAMHRFSAVRDNLMAETLSFACLDAAQLIKHAYGLRTAVHRADISQSRAILFYLYAEPDQWHNGRPVPTDRKALHRAEINQFAEMVAGDEVLFRHCSYRELVDYWQQAPLQHIRAHARALSDHFDL